MALGMKMSDTQKPHVPTLGTAVIAIVIALLLYHFLFSKRRR